METWLLEQQPAAQQLLRERTVALLRESPAPDDHDELLARGLAFIDRQGGVMTSNPPRQDRVIVRPPAPKTRRRSSLMRGLPCRASINLITMADEFNPTTESGGA
jgi:hypothetical protein